MVSCAIIAECAVLEYIMRCASHHFVLYAGYCVMLGPIKCRLSQPRFAPEDEPIGVPTTVPDLRAQEDRRGVEVQG